MNKVRAALAFLGKSFIGRIVDSDGIVGKFKLEGKSNVFEVNLSGLKESDKRIAILSIYKKKYQRALSSLQNMASKNSVDVVLAKEHIKNFYTFFTELYEGKNYVKSRLGKQFPVKFKAKEYIDERQPYHYWAYVPKNYDKNTLPLVFFYVGKVNLVQI